MSINIFWRKMTSLKCTKLEKCPRKVQIRVALYIVLIPMPIHKWILFSFKEYYLNDAHEMGFKICPVWPWNTPINTVSCYSSIFSVFIFPCGTLLVFIEPKISKSSPLPALKIVLWTTSSAANDENFIKMKTIPFQSLTMWIMALAYFQWHA